MRLVLALCAALALVACGDDDESGGPDASAELDSGSHDDAGPEAGHGESCGGEGPCDDGIRCNGIERCVDDDHCEPGEPVRCTPEHPCLESTGACDCTNPDYDDDDSDSEVCGGDDCNDADDSIGEHAPEVCLPGGDSVDEDCDPDTFQNDETNDGDADNDGHFSVFCFNLRPDGSRSGGDDCFDRDDKTYPGAEESCDYTDNDCDGIVDEGEVGDGSDEGSLQTAFYPDNDRDGYPDHDAEPMMRCDLSPLPGWLSEAHPDDCDDDDIDVNLAELEVCDGVDNDCDGLVDNDDNEETSNQPMLRPYDFEGTTVACVADPDDEDGDGRSAEWVIPPDGCPEGLAWCTGRVETGCTTDATTIENCGACEVECTFACSDEACDEVVELSVSIEHSCARTRSGRVGCWGRGALGRLGDDAGRGSSVPSQVVGATAAVAVVAGPVSSCVILGEERELHCWGDNEYSVLGNGEPGRGISSVPIPVYGVWTPSLIEVASVAIAKRHACAVMESSEVYCWGSEEDGRLGNGYESEGHYPFPIAVERESGSVNDANKVALGEKHGCLLTVAGTLECWGDNSNGQLGDPEFDEPSYALARTVPNLSDVTDIAAGTYHTCAVSDGQVWCWGANDRRQLGHVSSAQDRTPTVVSGLGDVVAVDAGPTFTCALDEHGTVWCWGSNDFGERGDSGSSDSETPVQMSVEETVEALSVDGTHGCVVTQASEAYCWGHNVYGQLGVGQSSYEVELVPQLVEPLLRSR
jgi:alpha-tubulin suppressor-like RCC1 family protein